LTWGTIAFYNEHGKELTHGSIRRGDSQSDKGKPGENRGRKAIGPVKWQPATERRIFFYEEV
jgi:hypothetical protein